MIQPRAARMTDGTNISVRLEQRTLDALDRIVRREHISRSGLAARAIREWLAGQDVPVEFDEAVA